MTQAIPMTMAYTCSRFRNDGDGGSDRKRRGGEGIRTTGRGCCAARHARQPVQPLPQVLGVRRCSENNRPTGQAAIDGWRPFARQTESGAGCHGWR